MIAVDQDRIIKLVDEQDIKRVGRDGIFAVAVGFQPLLRISRGRRGGGIVHDGERERDGESEVGKRRDVWHFCRLRNLLFQGKEKDKKMGVRASEALLSWTVANNSAGSVLR